MAVALGKSCNAVFRAQIDPQNREAEYSHPTGDKLFDHYILYSVTYNDL